jgi:hypothetical protein
MTLTVKTGEGYEPADLREDEIGLLEHLKLMLLSVQLEGFLILSIMLDQVKEQI